MDIRFYDYNLELLYILPEWSKSIGFSSCNTRKDFNGCGTFEIVFRDNSLKEIVESHKENMIIKWGNFCGFLTGFLWSEDGAHLYGMHLNGLLKNYIVPQNTDKAEVNAEKLILDTVSAVNDDEKPWLNVPEPKGWDKMIAFPKENYTPMDSWTSEILTQLGWGYEIYIDFALKQFNFKLKRPKENNLMFSENNLNAFKLKTTYDNKSIAYGGWYNKETETEEGTQKTWEYVTLGDAKKGIFKRDIVLSSKTEQEAINELKAKIALYDLTAETDNVKFGTDYDVGDIIRIQHENSTVRKLVSAVNCWQEGYYNEKPIFTEVVNHD